MIVLTGPQSTDEDRGNLVEMSGLLGAPLTCSTAVEWSAVTSMYRLEGWKRCPLAVADVTTGEMFDLKMIDVII